MTRPESSDNHNARAAIADRRRSQWLLPLVPVAIGTVILLAAALTGHILSGVEWFAALCATSAFSRAADRFGAARRRRHHDDNERDASINIRAMSIVGTVLVVAITGCAVFTLVRGESTITYAALLAVGGISYTVATLALRYGNP